MPASDGKWRILSLDGGGVRGMVTLQVLQYIEQRVGKRISEVFDLVVGTSTGGLITLGLTKVAPMSTCELAAIYESACPKIFARSVRQKVTSLGQLSGPKYSNEALYGCAMEIIGGKAHMRDAVAATGTPAAQAMVTTYDMRKRTPRFYTSWDTPDVLMIDAAMSTTAAPTYFAPWHDNVDGGVCDNNPALSGVIEWCRRQGCTVRDCLVVSVGTGSDMKPYSGAEAAKWGLLTWAEPLVSLFTDGTSELHTYHLQRLLPDENVLRLQCKVEGDLAELDNAAKRNLAALQQAGDALVQTQMAAIDAMLARLM